MRKSNKRRDFLKKAAYAAPAILSLQAVSSAAKAGSTGTTTTTTSTPKKSSPKPKGK